MCNALPPGGRRRWKAAGAEVVTIGWGEAYSSAFGADETGDGCTGFPPILCGWVGGCLEGLPELYYVVVEYLFETIRQYPLLVV